MKPVRKLGRRSFLARVAGSLVGAGALDAARVRAQAPSGCSDHDGGVKGDPAGNGRSCRPDRSGCSDSDPGDPGGDGQSCTPVRARCTDSDPADPAGAGRHCGLVRTNLTDSDPGDPPYYGRARSCSDADSGGSADPAGRGRRC